MRSPFGGRPTRPLNRNLPASNRMSTLVNRISIHRRSFWAKVGITMNDEERPDLLFNQSLEKGLAVLSAFGATRRTMTLADVAAATGMSKSSAQRMVHTLE